jgi:hypothetical protein
MFSHPARHALLRADILVKLNIKRGLSPVVSQLNVALAADGKTGSMKPTCWKTKNRGKVILDCPIPNKKPG